MELADATWPQVEAADRPVLLVPLGALEQHGPHLSLDTDARVATRVAAAVPERRPAAGLAPTIPLGESGEHAAFPGTLSIGERVLHDLLVELTRRAADHWRAVLVVNAHGGNAAALARARATCSGAGLPLAVHHVGLPGMDAHAGRSETSLMLHLDPASVRLELAEPGNTEPIAELLPRLRTDGVRAVSANGVLGDPRGASAAEGAELFGRLVDRAVAAYDETARGRGTHGRDSRG